MTGQRIATGPGSRVEVLASRLYENAVAALCAERGVWLRALVKDGEAELVLLARASARAAAIFVNECALLDQVTGLPAYGEGLPVDAEVDEVAR